jgi:hypothetical protein
MKNSTFTFVLTVAGLILAFGIYFTAQGLYIY